MFPLTEEDLDELSDDSLNQLVKLDKQGILCAPNECLVTFKERMKLTIKHLNEVDNELSEKGELELFDDMPLPAANRIGPKLLEDASCRCKERYGFSINWVPGFFLSKSLGLLWGGCAVSFPEEHFSVFLIRKAFMTSEKWFIYSREELLSHELCHVARAPLCDTPQEEHFAYAISSSAMRRTIGNCFQAQKDALIFLLPVLVLLGAQMTMIFGGLYFSLVPFWIGAVSGPSYLLLRNFKLRRTYFKARKKLVKQKIKQPDALLFRCTSGEIQEIAGTTDPAGYITSKWNYDLRWKVMITRFAPHFKQNGVSDDNKN